MAYVLIKTIQKEEQILTFHAQLENATFQALLFSTGDAEVKTTFET